MVRIMYKWIAAESKLDEKFQASLSTILFYNSLLVHNSHSAGIPVYVHDPSLDPCLWVYASRLGMFVSKLDYYSLFFSFN